MRMRLFLLLASGGAVVVALTFSTTTTRRHALFQLFAPAPALAVVPGGEFCICNPDGQCFGQNCGGLKPAENLKAVTIADARASYQDELASLSRFRSRASSESSSDSDSSSDYSSSTEAEGR